MLAIEKLFSASRRKIGRPARRISKKVWKVFIFIVYIGALDIIEKLSTF